MVHCIAIPNALHFMMLSQLLRGICNPNQETLFFVCLFVWIAPAEETPYSRSYFHASRLKEEVNSPGCGSLDSECR